MNLSKAAIDGKPRILLVEDEPLTALLVGQVVNECGYDCVGPISELATAINWAKGERIDAALLDLLVGDKFAYEVAEALALREIPFGFISGLPPSGIAMKWIERPFLEKPFGEDAIAQMLLTLLATKSASRQIPDQWRSDLAHSIAPHGPAHAQCTALLCPIPRRVVRKSSHQCA
jgi:CheY-like chemotaxis protein